MIQIKLNDYVILKNGYSGFIATVDGDNYEMFVYPKEDEDDQTFYEFSGDDAVAKVFRFNLDNDQLLKSKTRNTYWIIEEVPELEEMFFVD